MSNCEICGGELAYMGRFGGLCWFRCSACGLEFHSAITSQEEELDWGSYDQDFFDPYPPPEWDDFF